MLSAYVNVAKKSTFFYFEKDLVSKCWFVASVLGFKKFLKRKRTMRNVLWYIYMHVCIYHMVCWKTCLCKSIQIHAQHKHFNFPAHRPYKDQHLCNIIMQIMIVINLWMHVRSRWRENSLVSMIFIFILLCTLHKRFYIVVKFLVNEIMV